MPCWVAPIVAAELWHVTVAQIMEMVQDSAIESCHLHGFTLVDVAPKPPSVHAIGAPPTFTTVTPEEHAALVSDLAPPSDLAPAITHVEAPAADAEDHPLDPEEAADTKPLADWRQVRARMSRLRRPPACAAA